jgi:protease II
MFIACVSQLIKGMGWERSSWRMLGSSSGGLLCWGIVAQAGKSWWEVSGLMGLDL